MNLDCLTFFVTVHLFKIYLSYNLSKEIVLLSFCSVELIG